MSQTQRKKNEKTPVLTPPQKICSSHTNDNDRNSKINQPSSSDKKSDDIKNKNPDSEDLSLKEFAELKEVKEQETETETEKSKMSDILNEDEKILFSLQVVGSIQKNEKLTEKDGLPSIDDRYLQGIVRWYNGDSRHVTTDRVFQLTTGTAERVQVLLDEDYKARLDTDTKKVSLIGASTKESPEEKKFRESCEDRRRLISRYLLALSKTKQGIENLRETYTDKFTKEKLTLALTKVDESLEKLR